MRQATYFTVPLNTRVPGTPEPRTVSYSALCCTRCNACVQSCPSYLLQREEIFSPRGRVQLLRLLLEEKIKPAPHTKLIKQTLRACTLCARCTQTCAGQIPVAHHMIVLRRQMQFHFLPVTLRAAHYLRAQFPAFFDLLLGAGLLLRRVGLITLLQFFLPTWLRHAHKVLPHRCLSLKTVLKKHGISATDQNPDALYLPSLEVQYFDGNIARYTLKATHAERPHILQHTSSGLFEYMYGSQVTCLKQAKKLLRTWEKYSTAKPIALLTDSIEIYSFLKNYPLLFATLPGWKKRAEAFAQSVKFITDFSFADGKTDTSGRRAALDDSTVLYPPTDAAERARKILLAKFGSNMIQCTYSRFPVPVAGGAFAYPAQARKVVREVARDVVQHQVTDIYCLSVWAALEISAATRRYYPAATAKHIAYLQADYE